MELIDRYVDAVTARLSEPKRAEIAAELHASILDALDGRNASPDDEAQVVAVLAELGDPAAVAAEYEPSRRYLIGPELFPDFIVGLRVGLGSLAIACTLAFGAAVLLGGLTEFRAGDLLMDMLGLAFRAMIVGVVLMVAVFAWMQRANVRLPAPVAVRQKPWSPQALKRTRLEPLSRAEGMFGLVVAAVVLVILGEIGSAAREALATAPAQFRPLLADGVVTSVLILQLAMVLSVIAHAIALVRGGWDTATRSAHFVADLMELVAFARVPFIMLAQRAAILEAGLTPRQADWAVATSFTIVAVIAVITGVSWWRTWRRSGLRMSPAVAASAVAA